MRKNWLRLRRHFWKGSKLTAMILKFPISLSRVPLIHRSHVSLATFKVFDPPSHWQWKSIASSSPILGTPTRRGSSEKPFHFGLACIMVPRATSTAWVTAGQQGIFVTFHGVVISNTKFPLWFGKRGCQALHANHFRRQFSLSSVLKNSDGPSVFLNPTFP